MDTNVDKAINCFSSGFNCAQSVLFGVSDSLNIDKELALGITGAMGGGVRCGEMCGALLGASVAVGLKYGQKSAEDIESRNICTEKTKELTSCFKEKFGELTCIGLLGYDLNTIPQDEFLKIKGVKFVKCSSYVKESIEILDRIL